MPCGAPALPRLGLLLLACRAAALGVVRDPRQSRAPDAVELDREAVGPPAAQGASDAEGGSGVAALLWEALADQEAALDAEQQARWRRYPLGIVAASLSRRGLHQTSDANSKDAFPYIMLAGFSAFVALHALVNHVRGRTTHGGALPEPAEANEMEGGKKPRNTPAASAQRVLHERLEALGWVLCWMACSATFVIYNKWLFTKGGFPHPIYLTAFHMTTCFVAFWLVRIAAPAAVRDSIMPDAEKVIPWDTYLRGLFPISVLYGYNLGAGNLAFMYSSVAFLQMIKPINVLFTSLAAFAFQLETATMSHVIIVCIIFSGVSIAATGDVEFCLRGCILQLTACLSEGIRLALLQKVMTRDAKLDPVTTVYRFAPVAGLSLCLVAFAVETPVDWGKLKSPPMLVMNCVVALVLNVLIVTVIKKASAVVFTLAGILKDVGAICASVGIFATPIMPLELIGYGISVCGIAMFKCYKDNVQTFKSEGFVGGYWHVLTRCAKAF